jgi:O-acetyl-ADP-ribose deacetylase (regulator of RNase III)
MTTENARMVAWQGDITTLDVDAIVNAANSSLLGGTGVNGAIQRAAGPELLAECSKLGGCPTGQARITRGYRLPARHVIHTVGPVWDGGSHHEDEQLASCYRNSLALAAAHGLRTIAFPSISTGVYRFPLDRAVKIAVSETARALETYPDIERVTFVCFSRDAYDLYTRELAAHHESER